MFETLRCPSCSTRYELSPSRVRAGIRRALCFRCNTAFDIEDAVTRLLAPFPELMPPSLNLGDLEVAEASPYATSGVGYSSAREAIEKLMGNAPRQPAPSEDDSSMEFMDLEMEATLDALDTSLPEPSLPQQDMTSTV